MGARIFVVPRQGVCRRARVAKPDRPTAAMAAGLAHGHVSSVHEPRVCSQGVHIIISEEYQGPFVQGDGGRGRGGRAVRPPGRKAGQRACRCRPRTTRAELMPNQGPLRWRHTAWLLLLALAACRADNHTLPDPMTLPCGKTFR